MSNFRTKLKVPSSKIKISHQQTLFLVGSCFTENIGNKLSKLKFNTLINPFGILYNPTSIQNAITRLLNGEKYTEEEVFEKNGIWHSFDHHSVFSASDKETCLAQINKSFKAGTTALKNCDALFITFGSAHLYQLKESQKLVSNCHKYPSSLFDKKVFDLQQTFEIYKILFEKLKQLNPKMSIILTLSPVRYLSDGFVENQQSKSLLHLLCQNLVSHFDWIEYFPSYEIMMDDLRDYRFYKEDMIHPSDQAVNYIFDIFKDTYFSDETNLILSEIDSIHRAMEHRVFFKESEEHRKFVSSLAQKIENLSNKYPFIDFQDERLFFSKA